MSSPLPAGCPHTIGLQLVSVSSYTPRETATLLSNISCHFKSVKVRRWSNFSCLRELLELQDISLSTTHQNPLPLSGHIFILLSNWLQLSANRPITKITGTCYFCNIAFLKLFLKVMLGHHLALMQKRYWMRTVMQKKTTPSTAMANRFLPTMSHARGERNRFSP